MNPGPYDDGPETREQQIADLIEKAERSIERADRAIFDALTA